MKVALVGAGVMGRWFAGFAKRNRWDVVVVDIDIAKAKRVARELDVEFAKTDAEAVAGAQVAIVAVPIAKTAQVIREVSEHMQKGALLMDIASAKAEIVDTMRKLDVPLELVSIHPLFGPGATSIKGKCVVSIPVKPGKRYTRFKRRLIKRGAQVIEMDADEHDRLMAVTQCLTHFVLISYMSALRSMRGLERAKKLRTPLSAMLFDLGKATLAGNPELYGEVQVLNKYASVARSNLMEACRSLDLAFQARDIKAARQVFEEALSVLGPAAVKEAYKRLYENFEGKG